MIPEDEECLQTFSSIKLMLGSKYFRRFETEATQCQMEDTKANVNSISPTKNNLGKHVVLLEYVLRNEKLLIKYFCYIHGVKQYNTASFFDILNRKYSNIDTLPLFNFLNDNSKAQKFTNEIHDILNSIIHQTIKMNNIFKKRFLRLIEHEEAYLAFLQDLYEISSGIYSTKKLTDKDLLMFNLKDMIKISIKLVNALQKSKIKLKKDKNVKPKHIQNLFHPYKNYIQDLRETYVEYLIKKEDILQYYISNSDVFLSEDKYSKFFIDNKHISMLFLRPVIHIFRYITVFENLKEACFMIDEISYTYLSNSFKEIIGMANEKKRRNVTMTKYRKLEHKIDNFSDMNNDIKSLNFGDLLFDNESSLIFRKNRETYLTLFFEKGFVVILKNIFENEGKLVNISYNYLECIEYSEVRKCKVYDEKQVYQLKLVIKGKNGREMVVIPFHNHEFVCKVCDHINNEIYQNENEEKKLEKENKETKKKDRKKLKEKNNEIRIKEEEKKRNELVEKEKIKKEREKNDIKKKEQDEFVVKLECGHKRLLGFIKKKSSLDDFKKSIISQIGRESFPDRKIHEEHIKIDIFKDFSYFLRDEYQLYCIDSENTLRAAIKLSEKSGRMDIIVKRKENIENKRDDADEPKK